MHRIKRFSLVMVSAPSDYIGQGGTYIFESSDEKAGLVSWGDQRAAFDMGYSDGENGGYFEIAAPPGKKLRPGYYWFAQRAPFRDKGRPGIDIQMGSRGCNQIDGWFDVKYIEFDRAGHVERARVTFAQHCEGALDALYGELRIGRGATSHDMAVLPDRVPWPDTEVGATSWYYPVYVVPIEGGIQVENAVRRGPHRSDFTEDSNSCTEVTLRPGTGCAVILRFTPKAGGPRSSRLVIKRQGRDLRAVLEGLAIAGHSRLVMESEDDDYVGQGRTYQFDSAEGDTFYSWRTRYGVETWVDTSEGSVWLLDFIRTGDLQKGATYDDARRTGFDPAYPQMDVSGEQRGCNELTGEYTVNDLGLRPRGLRHYYSITFEQYCDGNDSPLRGTIDFRMPTGETDPPSPPDNVRIRRARRGTEVSWQPSPSDDITYYWMRYFTTGKVKASVLSGYAGYVGSMTSTTIRGARVRGVSVFAIDEAGNISEAATAKR